jgi:hypothetical protein
MKVPSRHVQIAKVVGESEQGMTLFVPKDLRGEFKLSEDAENNKFLTVLFIHKDDRSGNMESWIPWEH